MCACELREVSFDSIVKPSETILFGRISCWRLYKDLIKLRQVHKIQAYINAVALHRRGTNTYCVETIHKNRVSWCDIAISGLVWLLATLVIILSAPVVIVLLFVTSALGEAFDALKGALWKSPYLHCFVHYFVQTNVEEPHKTRIAEVLEDSYVGASLDDQKDTPKHLAVSLWINPQPVLQTLIRNLNYWLLDRFSFPIYNMIILLGPGQVSNNLWNHLFDSICLIYIKTLIIYVCNSWEDSV